jgi:hypothetical protein
MRRALPSSSDAGKESDAPLPVVILITGPVDPNSFHKVPADGQAPDCDCLVYYIQIDPRWAPYSNTHEMKKMLRPLNVRSFHTRNSTEIRGAIAEILREVGTR